MILDNKLNITNQAELAKVEEKISKQKAKQLKELCPDGVEWKTLGEVAELKRGRVMSKEYLVENSGTYPVYSSQTANNGEIGKNCNF